MEINNELIFRLHYNHGAVTMAFLNRITIDPNIMTGKPCIRDTRIPASIILKLLAKKESYEQILTSYPEIDEEDILKKIIVKKA